MGLAITAADPDSGDVLAYSVAESSDTGAAADLADFNRDFSLDAATGQVSVKATAAIDYETRSTYKVAYQVTDNKNAAGGNGSRGGRHAGVDDRRDRCERGGLGVGVG